MGTTWSNSYALFEVGSGHGYNMTNLSDNDPFLDEDVVKWFGEFRRDSPYLYRRELEVHLIVDFLSSQAMI